MGELGQASFEGEAYRPQEEIFVSTLSHTPLFDRADGLPLI